MKPQILRPLDPRQPWPDKPEGGKKRQLWRLLPVLTTLLCLLTLHAAAAGTLENMVTTLFGENTQTVDIILLLTVLTLIPSVLLMLTGFTRIIITLSFLRNALGVQQMPPNQVVIGLALFLTIFVMSPILTEIYEEAYIPYSEERIDMTEFTKRAMEPLRVFMLSQVESGEDIDFFIGLSGETFTSYEEVPNRILIPAFMTSEIKIAFKLGFFLYIPFIVIDMVVASTLMAMGMMMLPPAMISLPFKVLIFVLVDGWQLTIGTLMSTFT